MTPRQHPSGLCQLPLRLVETEGWMRRLPYSCGKLRFVSHVNSLRSMSATPCECNVSEIPNNDAIGLQ